MKRRTFPGAQTKISNSTNNQSSSLPDRQEETKSSLKSGRRKRIRVCVWTCVYIFRGFAPNPSFAPLLSPFCLFVGTEKWLLINLPLTTGTRRYVTQPAPVTFPSCSSVFVVGGSQASQGGRGGGGFVGGSPSMDRKEGSPAKKVSSIAAGWTSFVLT
jgi:hypothetical protein